MWTRRCYCSHRGFIKLLIPGRLDQSNVGNRALSQDGELDDHLSDLPFVGERDANGFCGQAVGFVLDVLRNVHLILAKFVTLEFDWERKRQQTFF